MAQNISTPTLNLTKLNVGTGFEQQQAVAAAKQRLAEQLMQQGIAPDENMRSPVQVLGHMAQAWAGKSMQKEALAEQAKVAEALRGKRAELAQQVYSDAASGMSVDQIAANYGHDPMAADIAKPFLDAYAQRLKNNEGLREVNGRIVRTGDVIGQANNDPNKDVFLGPDGQLTINPVKVTASVISQGKPAMGLDAAGKTVPYPTTGQMPGTGPLANAMLSQSGQSNPQPSTAPTPPAGGPKYVQVQTEAQYNMLAPGMTYLDPNGQVRVKGN